ncbi:MAG: energy transducer TonB [Ignavibacteriaceae bacterium]|jgi:TonB family protein|nr:energy transducer TonB [Ignavibacteriaceae bacterium]
MKIKLVLSLILIAFLGLIAQQKEGAKLQKPDESGFIEVDKAPTLKSQLKPAYPKLAKLAGIEGTVYLKLLINEKGSVEKAKVEQGVKDMLDNSALEAAKKALFSPAMLNNKGVKVWVILPVAFKLEVEKKGEGRLLKYDELVPIPSNQSEDDLPMDKFVEVEKMPDIINQVNPVYPEEAKKNGIEGRVWVKALVSKEGNVKKAVAVKSDNEIFNQSAIEAAMKYAFTPAMQGGKPVAVWVVMPFKFELDKEKK